jgi:hypothetical protein
MCRYDFEIIYRYVPLAFCSVAYWYLLVCPAVFLVLIRLFRSKSNGFLSSQSSRDDLESHRESGFQSQS